jgi:putative membrane protein
MAYSKTIILRAVLTGTTIFSAYGCANEKKEAANREKKEDLKSKEWAKKDAVFLAKAAEINIAEIRLGKLAEKQSMNRDVLDLGMALVHAHSEAQITLKEIAGKKLIALPVLPDGASISDYKELSDKSGDEFDAQFVPLVITTCQESFTIFEKSSIEISDAEINLWARGMLKDFQTHLKMAIACGKKLEVMQRRS